MTLADHILEEQALLGSCILNPANFDLVSELVCETDFVGPGHGKAWSGLCDLKESGGPVSDIAHVVAMLRRIGVLEAVGGVQEIAKWASAQPGSAAYHAGRIRNASQVRMLDRFLTEGRRKVEQKGVKAGEVATWLSCQLDGISGEQGIGLQTIGQAAEIALAQIDQAIATGKKSGISTGLADLDAISGGMFGGDMVVVAARPSVGKSALGVQIGMHASKTAGPVLLVSLEMRGQDLALRQFAKQTGLFVSQIRAAEIDPDERAAIVDAVDDLKETNLVLLASRNVTTSRIRAAARLQRSAGGLSMVVVDYLGLVKPTDYRQPRHEQVAGISAALKDLAMELDVPVMVLCQLNRDADKEKPKLSHLRDSGAVEQDADVVWLLHRDNKASTEATIEIAKNRQGATGTKEFVFDPSTTTFSDTSARNMSNYEPAFEGYEGDTPF